jgi:uncharacterized protein involved in exopolysaccharide biosynthesis
MSDAFVQEAQTPIAILETLRRRKVVVVAVTVLLLFASITVAVVWPPVYRSSGTILIEEPDVPSDLVKSTVSNFADDRLRVIEQRVMTTENLIGIMDRYGLYRDERSREPVSVVVDRMRGRIGLELLSADVADSKSHRATIAFTVSFESGSPGIAQQVASEMVTLYLSENTRARQEQAAGTTEFLSAETRKLHDQLTELEGQIAAFKAEHAGSLPEQLPANTQLLDRAESQLLEIIRQAQGLRERQVYLEAELAQLDPYATGQSGIDPRTDPAAQLQLLRSQYIGLSAKFGPNHPDVMSARRQLEAMEAAEGVGLGVADLTAELDQLNTELVAARQKFGEAHPDVKSLTKRIEGVKAALTEATLATGPGSGNRANPIYVQLQSQLEAGKADLNSLRAQEAALREKAKELEGRVFQTPEVERVYVDLTRRYDELAVHYQEVRAKESEAELAQTLEAERKGERFSVIEPPALPVAPIKPNRKAILLLGTVLAFAAGAGSGALADALDSRLYGSQQLSLLLGRSPLVVVPNLRSRAETRRIRLRIAAAVAVLLGTLAVGLALLYFLVGPLDLLLLSIITRLRG